jgi:hypothetical protein
MFAEMPQIRGKYTTPAVPVASGFLSLQPIASLKAEEFDFCRSIKSEQSRSVPRKADRHEEFVEVLD